MSLNNMSMEKDEETEHILILNIPRSYGSGDLRRFFTTFVENGHFLCFHYKRRPLQKLQGAINEILMSLDDKKLLPSSLLDCSSPTNCCIVKLTKTVTTDFLSLYQGRQWYGKDEIELESRCYSMKMNPSICLNSEIKSCMELKPPTLMPNGNVGTTTKFFMDAISSCRMPSKLIAKLDLDFPHSRTRRYANVPPPPTLDYKSPVEDSETLTKRFSSPFIQKKPMTVTGTIKANLYAQSMHTPPSTSKTSKDTEDASVIKEQDTYAYLGEEWERHQALNEGMYIYV